MEPRIPPVDLRDPDDYVVRSLVMDGALDLLLDILDADTGDAEDRAIQRACDLMGDVDRGV